MAKRRQTAFVCSACGHEEPKWLGRCPECGSWNSLEEVHRGTNGAGGGSARGGGAHSGADSGAAARPVSLGEAALESAEPYGSGSTELDRVLGGGIMPGSSVLIGGEPGIGKSTLLLQTAARAATGRVLYISGEESQHQIRLRARRLGLDAAELRLLCAHELEQILHTMEQERPELVVVDSIQTVLSAEAGNVPGTVSQIKYCAYELIDWAREHDAAVFFVAHVTKEGAIAGPKIVEHMVDTVLYFEQSGSELRFLRATKNRFGPTDEVGIFSMESEGLLQVTDPSSVFLVDRDGALPAGVVAAPVYEGSRVLLVELQALTVPAKGGMSRTFSDRIDGSRVSRVAAVLEKHLGVSFSDQDLYVNVAGGMRITEVGVELPLAVALYSARTGSPVPRGTTVTGELSLAGEIRPVSHLRRRVKTAGELGFTTCYGPTQMRNGEQADVSWEKVQTIGGCIESLFGARRGRN
jgi:DNA repair protein RadA/Sms